MTHSRALAKVWEHRSVWKMIIKQIDSMVKQLTSQKGKNKAFREGRKFSLFVYTLTSALSSLSFHIKNIKEKTKIQSQVKC
jgi:hypothetical protein